MTNTALEELSVVDVGVYGYGTHPYVHGKTHRPTNTLVHGGINSSTVTWVVTCTLTVVRLR